MNFFGIQIFSSRSSSWSKVRKQHILKFPNCAACGRSKNLDVHHIIPVSVDPTKELDPDNLITLCSDPCHFVFGHLMDYKSWNTDVIQDCGWYRKKLLNKPKK